MTVPDKPEDGRPEAPSGAASAAAALRARGVEPDEPATRSILMWMSLLLVLVIAACVGLWQYFKHVSREELYVKDLSRENPELLELRARDQAALTTYDVADPKAGLYQIPIEQAMLRLLADPRLLDPLPPSAVAAQAETTAPGLPAAPAPTPGPTPSPSPAESQAPSPAPTPTPPQNSGHSASP